MKTRALALIYCFLLGCSPTEGGVVFMGDSITAHFKPQKYPEINAGIPFETTNEMIARFDKDVLAKKPRAVVILGGTNDFNVNRQSPIANLSSMAEKAASNGICVIVGTLPPCDFCDPSSIQVFREENDQIKNLANARGYKIADYYSVMAQPDGSQIPGLFYDKLHPSKQGVRVMLDLVRPIINSCPRPLVSGAG